MFLLTHKVNKSPAGKTILEFEHYLPEQRVLVAQSTLYPVEADFYILFLPGHKVMMEAISIIDTVEVEVPISFDHAMFLVADFFAGPQDSAETFGPIMDAVEEGFQEAWPHVHSEG